ncbi:hypothetical protein ACP4OV_022321 [Aristida adscensionis]
MQARWEASQQAMEDRLQAERARMEEQFQERVLAQQQAYEEARARQDARLEQALSLIQTLGQAIGQPLPQILPPPALPQTPYYQTPNQSAASNNGPLNGDMSPPLPPMAPQWTQPPQWTPRGFVPAFSWLGAAPQPRPQPPQPPPENEFDRRRHRKIEDFAHHHRQYNDQWSKYEENVVQAHGTHREEEFRAYLDWLHTAARLRLTPAAQRTAEEAADGDGRAGTQVAIAPVLGQALSQDRDIVMRSSVNEPPFLPQRVEPVERFEDPLRGVAGGVGCHLPPSPMLTWRCRRSRGSGVPLPPRQIISSRSTTHAASSSHGAAEPSSSGARDDDAPYGGELGALDMHAPPAAADPTTPAP